MILKAGVADKEGHTHGIVAGRGVDNNAKTSDFHLKPFRVNGISAAYGDGEDTLEVMITDSYYNDGAVD